MVAGADTIDGMDLLRHGAFPATVGGIRAPSTLGSFLRAFDHGNVRQLAAVHRRVLVELAARTPLLPGADTVAFIDVDSVQRRVYGGTKQGAAFGHAKIASKSLLVRGLNMLAATVQHAAGRAGRGRGPAARRQRRLRPGRGHPGRRGDHHRPAGRRHRLDRGARGLRVLRAGRSSPPAAATGPGSRSPCGWTRRCAAPSPPSPTTPGPRSSTRTRSTTRRPASGSPTPRSPRCPTPRSPPTGPTAPTAS